MKNTHRNKYKPYIRRAKGGEKAEGFRDAIRLAFYQERGRPFFVMVQHGFPKSVIAVAGTRRDIQQSILMVAIKRKTFRKWASDLAKSSNVQNKKHQR